MSRFFEALRSGHSVNVQLRSSKQFNNPDILEKLISFWGLDEIGSNYPPALFDPHGYDDADFHTAIAERQAAPPAQPTDKPRDKIDFAPATPATTAALAPADKDGTKVLGFFLLFQNNQRSTYASPIRWQARCIALGRQRGGRAAAQGRQIGGGAGQAGGSSPHGGAVQVPAVCVRGRALDSQRPSFER